MLHEAATALLAGLQAAAGRRIVYRRGAASFEICNAVPGMTQFQVMDDQQFVEEIRSRDFLVAAAELKISGVTILPQRGDQIDEFVGSVTSTYEVMAPVPSQQPYRFSDSARTILRIFTKQIS